MKEKGCPFLFHDKVGVGNPVATQLKFTAPPAVPFDKTEIPMNRGLTVKQKAY